MVVVDLVTSGKLFRRGSVCFRGQVVGSYAAEAMREAVVRRRGGVYVVAEAIVAEAIVTEAMWEELSDAAGGCWVRRRRLLGVKLSLRGAAQEVVGS